MSDLKIIFLRSADVPAELHSQIDTVSSLAFQAVGDEDPQFMNLTWANSEWLALGFVDETLVSFFCMLKRQVSAGDEFIWTAGIGGVATHPQWQKKGYASQLLRAAVPFMRDEIHAEFGLLICSDLVEPVYAGCGWQRVGSSFAFEQYPDGKVERRVIHTCVMVLPLTDRVWPAGEVDFRGLPW